MFDASGETPAESNGAVEADEEVPTWAVEENIDHAVSIIYRGAKMNPLFEPHRIELERGIGVAQVHATLALVGMLERLDRTLKALVAEAHKMNTRRAGG